MRRWWDLRTRQLITSLSFPDPISSMELSPQTNRLVVTSGKTVAFIPASANGQSTHSLTLPYAPSSATIHPVHQDRFVTGCTSDEWVRVHGMDGTEREVLKGHHGPVHCVEFSPDGELFASGSGASSRPILLSCGPELTKHERGCDPQRTVRVPRAVRIRGPVLISMLGFVRRHDPTVADVAGQDLWAVAGADERRLAHAISFVLFGSRQAVYCVGPLANRVFMWHAKCGGWIT